MSACSLVTERAHGDLGVAREDWASGKHGASVDRLRLQSFPFLRGIRNGIRDEYLCTCVLAAAEACWHWQGGWWWWQKVEHRTAITGIASLERRVCCWVADADLPAENAVSPSKGLY